MICKDDLDPRTLAQMQAAPWGSLYFVYRMVDAYDELCRFSCRDDLEIRVAQSTDDIKYIAPYTNRPIIVDHRLESLILQCQGCYALDKLNEFIAEHNGPVIPSYVDGIEVESVPVSPPDGYTYTDTEGCQWTVLSGVWVEEKAPENKPVDIMEITRNMLR